MTACPSGAAKKVPIEPAAETMPKPRLRRSGTMTRAATLAAMPLVVHESAIADQHAGAEHDHRRVGGAAR